MLLVVQARFELSNVFHKGYSATLEGRCRYECLDPRCLMLVGWLVGW